MEKVEPLLIDNETWGVQELCEVIASRYFLLGNDGPLPASWEVEGLGGKDVSEQLNLLNVHIEDLGLIGSLEASNPPILSISRYPSGQVIMKGWQHWFVWSVMASFMTIVGSSWSTRYVEGYDSIPLGSIGQSLFFFTIPIMASILFASHLRKMVASRSGAEIGHIVPIIFPLPTPAWPFGIIGTLGQRSVDLVPISNRKTLGRIEIVAPLTLFIIGSLFTILGVVITPLDPPGLTEDPVIFEISFISHLASDILVGDDLEIKLQWLHPLGIAGIGLSIVGWGLLLPIPGFPGDRILHAILGPSEMRKGGNQTSIFIVMLLILVVVFAVSEYLPWIFLAAVGAWQRFNPDSVPQPLVVDEYTRLDENYRNGLISIIAIILILGFPGPMPSQELDDYDAGISKESWPEEIIVPKGEDIELVLTLEPVGVMPVSGSIQLRLEGGVAENWTLTSECLGEKDYCKFSGVTQNQKQEITVTISSPNESVAPHLLRIIVEVEGNHDEHAIFLSNGALFGPLDPFWDLNETGQGDRICVQFGQPREEGVMHTDNPFWEIENETGVEMESEEICMIGHEGAIQSLRGVDGQQRKLGPRLILEGDNGTNQSWVLPINGSLPRLQIFDGEFFVSGWFAGSGGYVINHADTGNPYCPSGDLVPEVNTSANWTRFVDEHSAIRIIGNFEGNGSLILGGEGWVSVCRDNGDAEFYSIIGGIDVLTNAGALGERIDETSFTIHNRENFSLPVSVEWYGDFQEGGIWDLDGIPSIIGPGEMVIVEIGTIPKVDQDQLVRAVWISTSANGLEIHLAARCPAMGCR
ncbi:MAG TPA: hypothetical protein QF703_02400 [Candidatus Thalassarchaeaceae archaeon]|nr:hypothetical protein [Candidatus Thalassarchaeaceae archaeon]